ncbi:hypothetical protein [Hydrogenophaga sp. NFH-34]|uniref:hypothetical protein n=1 Tax=Hydrogenophaga sp. NFH-34 TaxID=2744446 RepID=UPI001F20D83C|nr:hypothetical protein [Hydrogenophaga sp. NFH-34]
MNARAEIRRGGFWLAALLLAIPLINLAAWHVGAFLNPLIPAALWLVALGYAARHAHTLWPLLLVLPAFGILLLGHPVVDWDARSIWFFHAKRIFLDGSATAPLDNYAAWSHNDYPVLVPAMAASFARGLRHWNEIFPKLAIFATTAPVLLLMGLLLRNALAWGLWFTAVLALAGPLLINGYVDALTGLYFGAALAVAAHLQTPDVPPAQRPVFTWLLALLIAALTLTKNEGLPAAGLVALMAFTGPRWRRVLAACAAGFLVYLLLWKLHVWQARIGNDLFVRSPLQQALERLRDGTSAPLILAQFLRHSAPFLMAALALAWFGRQQRPVLGGALVVLGYAALLFGVYLMTPHNLDWHLGTSVSRTLLVVNLALVTFLAWALTHWRAAPAVATPSLSRLTEPTA